MFILCFLLFPAPPRLQLILYSNEEVRAAFEPLRAIPAFTDLLLTDPPTMPKRKRDHPAGDPKPQPQPDVPAKKVVGGEEPLPVEDKPVGASDPATSVVLMEIGGQEQAPPVAETGIGAKLKAPSRKPRKAGNLLLPWRREKSKGNLLACGLTSAALARCSYDVYGV